MNINLEYKIKWNDPAVKPVSNREVTYNYVSMAVNQKYERGLEGSLRRTWGRIQRKFDDAIEAGADEVRLDPAEMDFVKKCFEACKYHPATAKYVQVLEDEIDSWPKD